MSNRDRLYTVVMGFEGTTSVSQFKASSAYGALKKWLVGITVHGGYGLTDDQIRRLAEDARSCETETELAAITGLRNVWCATVLANDQGMALLNIIATSPNENIRAMTADAPAAEAASLKIR